MPGKKPSRAEVQESERAWELKEIQGLIDLLIDREIQEFEMEKDGMRIRILRGRSAATAADHPVSGNSHAAVSVGSAEPVSVPAVLPPQEPAAPEPAPEASEEGLHVMKSPMVGTFFAAPSPDAPPFVNVGDQVHVGQVLCIIEAMKLMNEIESEFAGEIVRIHVENGQPVEYGQPLFTIKSS
ncbi:MAG TPA: acetyl-CoA carboxylase biotin carboxyl carrier protein [Terriglobia bacterium]|jgi:acetyl-CoA carboxylase biotin carboxyl carrier protein|nr:acetyl-CoA carboxylase biotin carboxyl carrier protein [Terriglobia bacterium]